MKRVFFLSSQRLLGHGLEVLLRQDGRFEIVGRETDINRAMECVRELHPDVVIVDNEDPMQGPTTAVMRILGEGLGIRVIGLNLHNNTLGIYQGEKREVREVEDLLNALESDVFSPIRPARKS